MARILGIGSQWVNKQSWDLRSDWRGVSSPMYVRMMKKQNKSALLRTSAVIGAVNTLTAEGCSETGPGMHRGFRIE